MSKLTLPPVVSIKNALFKRSNLAQAPFIFKNPINLEIPNRGAQDSVRKWCVWGTHASQFLNVLSRREYLAIPSPSCIRYHKIGKDDTLNFTTNVLKFKPPPTSPHLSARFEFFKSEFDEKLATFIKNVGNTSTLVSYELTNSTRKIDTQLYEHLLTKLHLKDLENRLVIGLSNGQMRRSRLARALLTKNDLLIVDDLYLGLDPTSRSLISETINWYNSTYKNESMVIVGLRPQDTIPHWCTDLIIADETGVVYHGPNNKQVINDFHTKWENLKQQQISKSLDQTGNQLPSVEQLVNQHEWYNADHTGQPCHFQIKDLSISYRGVPVLKDIDWTILKKSMWHIQGNNGSGKSTLISLLTADHPRSWSSNIVDESNRKRKVGSSSYFDINKSIATSSPEIHSIALKFNKLTLNDFVVSGLNEDSSNNFMVSSSLQETTSPDRLKLCDDYMRFFGLESLKSVKFTQLSVNDQKLALFVRCLVKLPKLLILDESFSGMEMSTIEYCHDFLKQWPGTVLVIAHLPEEVPEFCGSSIKLIQPGEYEINEKIK
ncbi:hypothetical protein ACO0RG_002424 [Hanseniaspora osmophila]